MEEYIEEIGGQFVGSVFHPFNTSKLEVEFYLKKNNRNVTNCFNVNRNEKYVSWSLPDYYDIEDNLVLCVIRKRKWIPKRKKYEFSHQ